MEILDMVKVSVKPWKEIIVHEVIHHKIRDLVRLRILGIREGSLAQPLLWAEGVVFSRSAMPPTEDVIREQLQGIIHFSAVEWAIMPTYKKVLKSRGVTIPVINVHKNPTLRDVAKKLKETPKES